MKPLIRASHLTDPPRYYVLPCPRPSRARCPRSDRRRRWTGTGGADVKWECPYGWTPDELNPGPGCPYCEGRMCARLDGLDCRHDRRERHGYDAALRAALPEHREETGRS